MATIYYKSVKQKQKKAFDDLLQNLKEKFVKDGYKPRILDYDKTLQLLADELNVYPEDLIKVVESSIKRGDLILTKTLSLGPKHYPEKPIINPEIEEDFKNVGV